MNTLPRVVEAKLSISRTRGGVLFDPNQERWVIREGVKSASLNFQPWIERLAPDVLFGLKQTLIWYGENKSLDHTMNMFKQFCYFLEFVTQGNDVKVSEISHISLLNYHSSLVHKWYLGSLAGFLKKWYALGYLGVTAEAINLLKELRLKGNKKGEAVLTLDPYDGPFTDIELESLQSALNRAYSSNSITEDEYILAWLFMLLGQRPAQYALLKVCDVLAPTIKDGSKIYILRVPRVKQRKVARLEFKERLITPQIGGLLYKYALKVKISFEGLLGDPNQAPLFPQSINSNQPVGMEFHQTATLLSSKLTKILDGLEVFSERTGDLVHITATRFRRTIGTRAAQEGHGELIIAELLDHTDTQNVGVYVQATPEIVERIDQSVAMALAPLAQAFAGVIIGDESEATRGSDPSSRILDPRIDKTCQPMGNCGSHGFCGFSVPIACYTCPSFQAWLDGPHEAVLHYLLAERERKKAITDQRIASIHDRTILAVSEVIRQCQSIKSDTEVTNG